MPTDEEEDNEAVAGSLVDALVEANTLELLVKRLTELNESVDEEAAAVNNALGIIEHAVEVRGNWLWLWLWLWEHLSSTAPVQHLYSAAQHRSCCVCRTYGDRSFTWCPAAAAAAAKPSTAAAAAAAPTPAAAVAPCPC